MIWDYLLAPTLAWLLAGSLKFIINSLQSGTWAFNQIGYGGLPSNHSAIVSSTLTLIALKEGIDHPAFGVALTLTLIVMMDANSLRKKVGEQATVINQLSLLERKTLPILRERMGHSVIEIIAGVGIGIITAILLTAFN